MSVSVRKLTNTRRPYWSIATDIRHITKDPEMAPIFETFFPGLASRYATRFGGWRYIRRAATREDMTVYTIDEQYPTEGVFEPIVSLVGLATVIHNQRLQRPDGRVLDGLYSNVSAWTTVPSVDMRRALAERIATIAPRLSFVLVDPPVGDIHDPTEILLDTGWFKPTDLTVASNPQSIADGIAPAEQAVSRPTVYIKRSKPIR